MGAEPPRDPEAPDPEVPDPGAPDPDATLVVRPRSVQVLGVFAIGFGIVVFASRPETSSLILLAINLGIGTLALRSVMRVGPDGVHLRNGLAVADLTWDEIETVDLDLVTGIVEFVAPARRRRIRVRQLTGRYPARQHLADELTRIANRQATVARRRGRGDPPLA